MMPEVLARPNAPWALRLLPPFPAVAQRVLALVDQEEVAIAELGELLRMDPSFSAELLRYANSALIGSRHEVKSVARALLVLGLERLKTLATMVAVNRMVRSSIKVEALRKIWMHSLVTALVAEEAARCCGISPDAAYTAGLLHNLGTLGLMSAYPEEYTRMLSVTAEFGFDLLETEHDLFDIDHCLAGCYLAQDWDFPDELAGVIAMHHEDPIPQERSLDNVVRISWRLTDALGFVAFPPERDLPFEQLVAFLPQVKPFAGGRNAEEFRAVLEERITRLPA